MNHSKARALVAAKYLESAIQGSAATAEDVGRALLRIAEAFEPEDHGFTPEEVLKLRDLTSRAYDWREERQRAYVDEIASCFKLFEGTPKAATLKP